MKKQVVAILVVGLFACLALCALSFQLIFRGCLWWECAPQRSFRVMDLDLPASLFPSGAIVNSLYPLSESEGTIENGGKAVYWDQGSGIAVYEVLRFPSARRATQIFPFEKRAFTDRVTKGPWTKPSSLTVTGAKASEFYVVCGNWSEYRCGMVARYEEYVIHFNAVIDSKMTYQGFEKIVAFIDKQMSDHLYPETQR